jgi:hypothetical protein
MDEKNVTPKQLLQASCPPRFSDSENFSGKVTFAIPADLEILTKRLSLFDIGSSKAQKEAKNKCVKEIIITVFKDLQENFDDDLLKPSPNTHKRNRNYQHLINWFNEIEKDVSVSIRFTCLLMMINRRDWMISDLLAQSTLPIQCSNF